jgi:hypothetical protein
MAVIRPACVSELISSARMLELAVTVSPLKSIFLYTVI